MIDRAAPDATDLSLKQFSAEGAFLRQLLFEPGEPQPKVVSASSKSDKIFLLETSPTVQRVRGLTLVATNAPVDSTQKAVSDWKIEFEKDITAHPRFAIVGGKPLVGPDPAETNVVTVKLRANPLEKDAMSDGRNRGGP